MKNFIYRDFRFVVECNILMQTMELYKLLNYDVIKIDRENNRIGRFQVLIGCMGYITVEKLPR